MPLRRLQAGFSLIELMVVLAIIGISLSVALPRMQAASRGQRMEVQARALAASVQLARSEAIKRNGRVTLCVSFNGTSCTAGRWDKGWIVLATLSDNSTRVLDRGEISSGTVVIKESASTGSYAFDGSGLMASTATFTVCTTEVSGTASGYNLAVSLTGRTTLSATSVSSCP